MLASGRVERAEPQACSHPRSPSGSGGRVHNGMTPGGIRCAQPPNYASSWIRKALLFCPSPQKTWRMEMKAEVAGRASRPTAPFGGEANGAVLCSWAGGV